MYISPENYQETQNLLGYLAGITQRSGSDPRWRLPSLKISVEFNRKALKKENERNEKAVTDAGRLLSRSSCGPADAGRLLSRSSCRIVPRNSKLLPKSHKSQLDRRNVRDMICSSEGAYAFIRQALASNDPENIY